jgi:hypothetical protein
MPEFVEDAAHLLVIISLVQAHPLGLFLNAFPKIAYYML